MNLEDWIMRVPKTETHLHLEGSLQWELLQTTNPGKYEEPPASWARDFVFDDFAHFEGELLTYAGDFFNSAERYRQAAAATFQRQLNENVRYTEVSFASGCIDFMNLDAREVAAAIRSAVPDGLIVRIFMGIHHFGYTEKMGPILEDALGWDELDGIDLHGAEDAPLEEWTASYWQRAREAGKFTKAHAGEFGGAEFVQRVVDELGVRRIQHGVQAADDPELMKRLASEQIVLDVCPISNIKLGVSKDGYGLNDLRKLYNAGVRMTISTDDPISFGNSLIDDYAVLLDAGFSANALRQFVRNGFEAALVDAEQRNSWLKELDECE